jgi:AcrR family transcriptional regulator
VKTRRGSKRNTDEGTRDRVLHAALKLFADRGYGATSIRDITEAASVNVAAVNYHFGGKEKLYVELIRERVSVCRAERRETLARATADSADIETILRAYVRGFFSRPSDQRGREEDTLLFFREMTTPGPGFEIIMKEMIEPNQKELGALLLTHIPGMTRERAVWCIVSMMGMAVHFLRARRVVSALVGREYDESLMDEMADHIVRFSLWGMHPSKERQA